MTSSLATAQGGLAYASYAAACHFQDAFVRRHNRAGDPWKSLGWDVWRFGFEREDEQITAGRRDLADLAMSPEEGEEAFRRALACRGADVTLVSTADLSARIDERQRRVEELRGRGTGGVASLHPRPDLPNPYEPPSSDLERAIGAAWQSSLGFEEIGRHDNFFELGGDSFLAVQVVERLKEGLGVELPVAKLYQGLTIASLAELLGRDDTAAREERAAHLSERRASMGRRKELFERRRALEENPTGR